MYGNGRANDYVYIISTWGYYLLHMCWESAVCHMRFNHCPIRSRREQSKSLLENKPDGTFLVRPKENYNNELPTTQEPIHCYTIDIM